MQNTNLATIAITQTLEPFEAPHAKIQTHHMLLPLLGRKVSCGLFGIGDDFIEKYQSLDSRFIRNKSATFFFEAAGESMEPTIYPGEVLVVDRSISHFHNRVCIISYDGQLICKRVLQQNNYVTLRSDNEKFKDIIVRNPESVSYWGVVIARAGEVI